MIYNTINYNLANETSQLNNKTMKLDLNENYIGPSTSALKAIKNFNISDISHYPNYDDLMSLISKIHSLDINQILLTNGVDDAFSLIFKTYSSRINSIATVVPNCGRFDTHSQIINAQLIEVPYQEKWIYPESSIVDALNNGADCLVITSPNNPTGDVISRDSLCNILDNFSEKLVVIDETYSNFSSYSNLDLIKKYSNLIIIKSLSIDYALAGLRIGYIVSQKETVSEIKKYTLPNNVNSLAVLGAIASLRDTEYMRYVKEEISDARVFLTEEFKKKKFTVYPSEGNFLLVNCGHKFKFVTKTLTSNNVQIKTFPDVFELKNCIRITIPTLSASMRLLDLLHPADALIFEIDDVLFDISNSVIEAIALTCEHFTGKRPDFDEIYDLRQSCDICDNAQISKYIIDKSGFNFSFDKISEVYQKIYWNDGQGLINNEVLCINIDILRDLSSKYKLNILSNRCANETQYILEKYGIKDFFDIVLTNEIVSDDIPEKIVLSLNYIKSMILSRKMICFSSNPAYINTIIENGIDCVGVLNSLINLDLQAKTLLDSGAQSVIKNINELPLYLEDNN